MKNDIRYRMPAEWEPHSATWIAWPHEESDWAGKFAPIDWIYVDIVRLLALSENVEVLLETEAERKRVETLLLHSHVNMSSVTLHVLSTNRSWLRDSAPTGVYDISSGKPVWIEWTFNAWAKYDNFDCDRNVPQFVAERSERTRIRAKRSDGNGMLVLEGGAIETDGEGTLIVTEECLLSDAVQCRNPGFGRAGYEEAFRDYLGIKKTIWLPQGIVGDDTHGHIDDIVRFVRPGVVVSVVESDPSDENYQPLQDNLRLLRSAKDAAGRMLEVIELPMPKPVFFGEERLPASYANFYIANRFVLVPIFHDESDIIALTTLKNLFPDRAVVGLACRDLVMGQGTLHCLSQQQPLSGSSE